MKNNYYVIGLPVDHSLSPLLHNTLYDLYGLSDCEYHSLNVAPGRVKNFIEFIPQQNIRGFNVTMPLKTEILPFLSYRDDSVSYGANTVVVQPDGALWGYSTDAAGFYQSLRQNEEDYNGKNVVFLGCGAVAQTLIQDAASKKAKKIVVLNRTPEKARQISDDKTIWSDDLRNIKRYMECCDLLINTTPLGMSGVKEDFPDLSFLSLLPKNACVCDLIYRPARTALLAEAERLGLLCINGLGMLIWQAFYAFEKFLGILPDEAAYRKVEQSILEQL